MFRLVLAVVSVLAVASPLPAAAQTPPAGPLQILPPTLSTDLRITWEVKNRFRLFRKEADFLKHVAALSAKSILASEQLMAAETDGRGWARAMLSNLCIDAAGNLMTTCERDGARESYLAPTDHRVEIKLVGAPAGAACSWTFDDGAASTARAARTCASALSTASRPR